MNYMYQNCAVLPREVLKILGIEVEIKITRFNLVWESLPGIEQIPYLGTVWKTIKVVMRNFYMQLSSLIPSLVQRMIVNLYEVVTYIPKK